jgi:hypothetical protein
MGDLIRLLAVPRRNPQLRHRMVRAEIGEPLQLADVVLTLLQDARVDGLLTDPYFLVQQGELSLRPMLASPALGLRAVPRALEWRGDRAEAVFLDLEYLEVPAAAGVTA